MHPGNVPAHGTSLLRTRVRVSQRGVDGRVRWRPEGLGERLGICLFIVSQLSIRLRGQVCSASKAVVGVATSYYTSCAMRLTERGRVALAACCGGVHRKGIGCKNVSV